MAVRKLQLYSNSPEEITLIGISSAVKDYRLIHYFNKQMRVDFAKIPDLQYYVTSTRMLTISLYHFFHDLSENNWIIFSNRSSDNEYVLPQYKNLDFFLLIDDLMESGEKDLLIKKMRKVKGLSLATEMDIAKVKKIDLLYADLEMHLTEVFKKQNKGRE
ncbi:MAG: IPExxxVDY family protein [Bacteroidales bacterium]|nr:IPExxxVDY family protein [Bacteroidales bacterium]MCF8336881.1 IPExxxVDY family protein [Bacteroidales bacterium]